MEMRLPGSGSHASTLPSRKNHCKARPRCARSTAKFATTPDCPYARETPGMPACSRVHERTPSAPTINRADIVRPSSSRSSAAPARQAIAVGEQGATMSSPGVPRAAWTSAALSSRFSTIHASARSPSS
jgi:hypothetical protein